MIIYKVHLVNGTGHGSEHNGYYYTLSKRDANNTVKENESDAYQAQGIENPIEKLYMSFDKHSIIAFLNEYCSHPDNG